MRRFKEIDYIPKSGPQFKLFSNEDSNLSVLSLEILDAILRKRVTLIFSQGPLNITAVVSCLSSLKNKNILIGLPKDSFQERYAEYTREYFSLLYREVLGSVVTNPTFFYRDVLWCKGKIDEENNELIDLIIEKRPLHGKTAYRTAYEKAITEKLNDGHYKKSPIIVLIPIDFSIPSNITEIKRIQFKDTNYEISNFKPGLIILESINERHFQFEHLKTLIKKTCQSGIKLVLHFSWPYLRGLDKFLDDADINSNSEIGVFHLGKRYCFELRKDFKKPPAEALPLSLEGELWDTVYYPCIQTSTDISVITLANQQKSQSTLLESLVHEQSSIDDGVHKIRDNIRTDGSLDNFTKSILMFPPVIDSFLAPSEIKVRSYIEQRNSWMYIPVQEFVRNRTGEDNQTFQLFQGLCSTIESSMDIARSLRGLRTNAALSKKTLLQVYFFGEIQKAIRKVEMEGGLDNAQESINLIIPKLQPFFETRKNNFESLQYFFESFSQLLTNIETPRLLKKVEGLSLSTDTNEIPIFNGTSFITPSREAVRNMIDKTNRYPFEISIEKDKESFELTVSLKIQLPYSRIHGSGYDQVDNLYCNGLDVYHVKISRTGEYTESYLSKIYCEQKVASNSLCYIIDCVKVENKTKITHKVYLNIEFKELSSISHIPQKKITNSTLLMQGPVPFQTISDYDVFITQGYDALLLPFKEIVFFAYPGKDLQRILKQLSLSKDILSETPTRVSNVDLRYSVNHTNPSTRYRVPQISPVDDEEPVASRMVEGDTIIDTAIRRELLEEKGASDDERDEIRSLKEIWSRIGGRKPVQKAGDPVTPSVPPIQREQTVLTIRFVQGVEEIVSFTRGTLIRKRNGDDFLLIQVDDLTIGDEILYIEAEEKESIDNYLLRDFAEEKGISLEQFFEPFYCLRLFFEVFSPINYAEDFPETMLKRLYWLNESQLESLFNTLRILKGKGDAAELAHQLNDTDNIWSGRVTPYQLTQIWGGDNSAITYDKMFGLARHFGLSLTRGTFRQYCRFAVNEQRHYYFINDKDLLAIGILLGHQEIIDNYQIINSQGRDVSTILQIIGRSISRVARGQSDQLSEMDASIEGKIQRGTVISINDQQQGGQDGSN